MSNNICYGASYGTLHKVNTHFTAAQEQVEKNNIKIKSSKLVYFCMEDVGII